MIFRLGYFLLSFLVAYFIPIILYKFKFVGIDIYQIINLDMFVILWIVGIFVHIVVQFFLFFIIGKLKDIDIKYKDLLQWIITFYLFIIPIVGLMFTIAVDNVITHSINYAFVLLSIIYCTLVLFKYSQKLSLMFQRNIFVILIAIMATFVLSKIITSLLIADFAEDVLNKKNIMTIINSQFNKDLKAEVSENENSVNQFIKLNELHRISQNEYEYVVNNRSEFNLKFPEEMMKLIPKVLVNDFDIKKQIIAKNFTYKFPYKVKPTDVFTLKFVSAGFEKTILLKMVYDVNLQNSNIDDLRKVWFWKQDNFVKTSNKGVILNNTSLVVDSFGFRRRFDGDVSFEFEFLLANNKTIDMSVFFGERTYFSFTNKEIKVLQKEKKHQNGRRVKSCTYERFIQNKKYKVTISRRANIYELSINNGLKLTYTDNNPYAINTERFKNIGIALPKNGVSVQLTRVIVR